MSDYVYDESVEFGPDGKPVRGAYKPIHGVWFNTASPEYKVARRAMLDARRKNKMEQWKKQYEAELAGEFVFNPRLPWPEEIQKQWWDEGKRLRSTFWQDVFENYVKEED